MAGNLFKARLAANEPSFIFAARTARTMDLVWLAEAAGFHAFYVDLQHSSIGLDTTAQLCQAAQATAVTALVRVPSLETGLIARLLDSGAQGIIAPDIRSAADAASLVEAALLEPRGHRSVASGIPTPRTRGIAPAAVNDALNEATLLIAMIESPEGVAAAAEIAAVEGIDALHIGCNDLTTAMGIKGDYRHERLRTAIATIIDAGRAAGKPVLLGGVRKKEDVAPYVKMGVARCYFTGVDSTFLLAGARASVAEAQAADAAATQG